jgi:hypothetical protein
MPRMLSRAHSLVLPAGRSSSAKLATVWGLPATIGAAGNDQQRSFEVILQLAIDEYWVMIKVRT